MWENVYCRNSTNELEQLHHDLFDFDSNKRFDFDSNKRPTSSGVEVFTNSFFLIDADAVEDPNYFRLFWWLFGVLKQGSSEFTKLL